MKTFKKIGKVMVVGMLAGGLFLGPAMALEAGVGMKGEMNNGFSANANFEGHIGHSISYESEMKMEHHEKYEGQFNYEEQRHNEEMEEQEEQYEYHFKEQPHQEYHLFLENTNEQEIEKALSEAGVDESSIQKVMEYLKTGEGEVKTIFELEKGNVELKTSNRYVVELLRQYGFKVHPGFEGKQTMKGGQDDKRFDDQSTFKSNVSGSVKNKREGFRYGYANESQEEENKDNLGKQDRNRTFTEEQQFEKGEVGMDINSKMENRNSEMIKRRNQFQHKTDEAMNKTEQHVNEIQNEMRGQIEDANEKMNSKSQDNFHGKMNMNSEMNASFGAHGKMNIKMKKEMVMKKVMLVKELAKENLTPEEMKQIKMQIKEQLQQVKQEEQQVKQEIKQVKEELVKKLKEKKKLDPEDKEKVIQVIQQALTVKLDALSTKLADLTLELKSLQDDKDMLALVGINVDDYLKQIEELSNKLEELGQKIDQAKDIEEIKALVKEYIQLKLEIKKLEMKINTELNVNASTDNNSVSASGSASASGETTTQ